MATQHESYCDETHSPRQRCNRALAPAPVTRVEFRRTTGPTPPTEEPPDAEPTPSEVVREAVAAGTMPAPSPYVTRAWEDTARAVGPLPEPSRTYAPGPTIESGRRIPRPVIAFAAVGVMIAVVMTLRPSRRVADPVGVAESIPLADDRDD